MNANIPIFGRMLGNNTQEQDNNSEENIVNNNLIKDYYNQLQAREDLIQNFDIISRDLIKMEFNPKHVFRCFLVHKYRTAEEGIELLSKTNGIWNHQYVPGYNKCFICDDNEKSHRGQRNTINIDNEKLKIALIKRSESFKVENTNTVKIYALNCPICFMEIDEHNKIKINCEHIYCRECIVSYLEEEIKNSRVKSIKCPTKGCEQQGVFTEEQIKALVSEDYYGKYIKFLDRERIKENPSLILCPIADCEGYANKSDIISNPSNANPSNNNLLIEENVQQPLLANTNNNYDTIINVGNTKIVCNRGHPFCSKCNQAWHGETQCEEDREIKDFATNSGFIVKKCPQCKVWTEKNSGCNHMTCQQCTFSWCWLCEAECPPEHYNTVGTPCYGKLFEGISPEEMRRLEREMLNNINMFTFFFIGLFVGLRVAITEAFRRHRPNKIIFFFCFSFMMMCILLLSILSNFIFSAHLLIAFRKVQILEIRPVRIMFRFIMLMLFFIFYLPGIFISLFVYLIYLVYTIYLLCII
jgi:hypothetical protein